MQIIHSIAELRQRLSAESNVTVVPTMGNLHEGHLSLAQRAKARGSYVVVSIFVNHLQFEPGGDFDRYPRTLNDDCAKLKTVGVDIVFAPDDQEMYPEPQQVIVQPPPLAEMLEGEYRPGHFAGMLTVVLKLLNIVQPDAAIFGKKDYQQLAVIREMVQQVNLPVEIIAADTVRAADGLALSSRNGYLSEAERTEAVRLNQQLRVIKTAIESGQRDYASLEDIAISELTEHGWKVNYIAVREQRGLSLPHSASTKLVVLAAAWLGKTRLIDNLEIALT
ncbi:MAG: pantoate--beta-alanine ligase [Pseudomonadota bacterium]